MAKRRMVLENLIECDDFSDLPHAAQALYLHLNMTADDDGMIGNAARLMRALRISKKSLEVLVERGYVILFDSGVAAITHWLSHNRIKKDRYTPSRYRDELSELRVVDDAIYVRAERTESGADSEQKCPVSAPQVSIGKVSIGKVSSVEDSQVKERQVKDSQVKDSQVKDSRGKSSEDKAGKESEEKAKATAGVDKSSDSDGYSFGALMKDIDKYFISMYKSVSDGKAFKEYYEKRGWRSEDGRPVLREYRRFADEWMKKKNGAPVSTPS